MHRILKNSLHPPFPEEMEQVVLGMGCFWCSENLFMRMGDKGIYSTHVGYAGGERPNPTYRDICTGQTGHAEVVRLVYDAKKISLPSILKIFWEKHDPTTLNAQGNDRGTQYRSCIFTNNEKNYQEALASRDLYQKALDASGKNKIVTEILPTMPEFHYAEEEHQQYDAKPDARQYCGLRPLNVAFPDA